MVGRSLSAAAIVRLGWAAVNARDDPSAGVTVGRVLTATTEANQTSPALRRNDDQQPWAPGCVSGRRGFSRRSGDCGEVVNAAG